MEPVKPGFDLRCATLDHDLPRNGDAERDLRHALLTARNPQTSWIADHDLPIFGFHVWHRTLEAGLVERALHITRTQGQPESPRGEDKLSAF